MTHKMPTSKRKTSRKRWKRPEIIDKRPNHQLGFNALPTSWKLAANGRWFLYSQQMIFVFPADGFCVFSRWFLCFHDVVFVSREQHTLQPLALVFVSVRVLCAIAHTRVRATIAHVQFSARNLTRWLPFLRTNRPPRRKKSILAKVGFDAKRD